MRKFFLAGMLLIACSLSTFAQQRPELKFNSQGNFKIVQFTDVHYKYGKPESNVAVDLIKEVLDAEKPDLVIFTGDVIWSRHAKDIMNTVFKPLIDKKIPWAYVNGNHDGEVSDMTYRQIVDYASHLPYSLTEPGDRSLEGVGNYTLEIKADNSDSTMEVLYLMDSGSYARMKICQKGWSGYSWFGPNQINWYRAQSEAYTKANSGTPVPSLAFFHIPLYEYSVMSSEKGAKLIGTKGEAECNGKLNSGMFTAMKECGDIMATFAGHDHDNDYIGEYYGIYLGYGRYSGGKTVYNNLGKNGCRVIELNEGKRSFSTYIRLLGGEKLYPVSYPTTLPLR